jgi:tetratricopeptide (TPR) repeat protein
MSKLHELFPTAESLLELAPDALAPILLRVVAAERQGGMFWPPIVTLVTIGSGMTAEGQHAYPYHKQHQVDALVAETFELLRRMGMIHPAPDTNGQNGWMVLSRDGEEAIKGEDGFDRIRALRSFPKELLHPTIAKDAHAALQRGDLSTAVRDAFTAVEISVRDAGGFTYHSLARYTDAEPLYRRAIEIGEKVLGGYDPSVATGYSNLAALLHAQGKYEEAEPLFRRAIRIKRMAFGKDDPRLASTYNNLAALLRDQGKHEQADTLFRQVIEMKEKALGKDHPCRPSALVGQNELIA